MIVFPGFDIGSSMIKEMFGSMVAMAWVLIPIAGIIWLLVAGISEEKTKRHRQELLHKERMVALEKGMTDALERTIQVERDLGVQDIRSRRNPNGLLVGGIITVGAGLGLTVFMRLAVDGNDRAHAMAVGLIPLFVGLSLIVAWFVTRRLGGYESSDLPRGRS